MAHNLTWSPCPRDMFRVTFVPWLGLHYAPGRKNIPLASTIILQEAARGRLVAPDFYLQCGQVGRNVHHRLREMVENYMQTLESKQPPLFSHTKVKTEQNQNHTKQCQ